MAAESCGMCLFEAMDHLWFAHIITFSYPSHSPITSKSSKNISQISRLLSHQQISSASPATACSHSQVEPKAQETNTTKDGEGAATSANLASRKARSNSSSPTSGKKPSRCGEFSETSVSWRSLGDLELEELKGFMDLGFVFKKENLSRRVVSLFPGLQRMNCDGDEEGEGKLMMVRPYLSEAWIDSPLKLSIRISRVCDDSDKLKKHLKDWARTVAASIHQDS